MKLKVSIDLLLFIAVFKQDNVTVLLLLAPVTVT